MNKIRIRGVLFDDVDMNEAEEFAVKSAYGDGGAKVIYTPNSEIVQLCIEDREIMDIINSADLIIPDGAGIILASKILGTPLKKGKVAGVELAERIAAASGKCGYGIYLLGGKPGVAEEAAAKLAEKYPDIIIRGTADGYFGENSGPVIERINASGAEVLFVCLGVPKQEKWIFENRDKLSVKLIGAFGGTLDVFAGRVRRAPKFFVKLGLEWFYRLLKQPSRFVRMLKLPKFIFGTAAAKLFGKE